MRFLDHVARMVAFMRWRAALALVLLAATGLIEGAGLLLLIPLLGAIGLDVQQGSIGRLGALVSRGFQITGLTPTLGVVLVLFFAANATLAMLRRAQTLLSTSLEQDVTRCARTSLYDAVVRMGWLAFTRTRAADLTLALTSESERVGVAASQLLSLSASLIVTVVYVSLAVRLSMAMTAAVFACGAMLLVLLRRRTKQSASLGKEFAVVEREYQAAVTDDLAGMKTIRAHAAGEASLVRVAALADRIAAVRRHTFRHYANGAFRVEIGSVAILSALVFVAVDMLQFTATGLILLLFLFARIVPRLATLQQNLQFYVNLLPACGRLFDLEMRCRAAAETPALESPRRPLSRMLQLEAVSFWYHRGGPAVLANLDLSIEVGTTVALVGPSGAGKTTVADVIMGLLAPSSGRVVVDGVELTPATISGWRQTVAYVPQDTFLFHETVRANLRWAAPDATDADLAAALEMAAAGFVLALPAGLDTIAGDRGTRFSGGERQRIALSRALLRRPSVLILDEATNALDPENEGRILDAIKRLHGTMTIIVITHRVSTASCADVVHVLENGRIIESGTPLAPALDETSVYP